MFEYLRGRSGRAEFWASVGILIVVTVALALLKLNGAGGVMMFLWLLIWARRLHDLNRSSLWGLLPFGVILVLTVVAVTVGGNDLMDAVTYGQTGAGKITDKGLQVLLGFALAVLVVQGGFTIWLGSRRGDAGTNRFGPPPAGLTS